MKTPKVIEETFLMTMKQTGVDLEHRRLGRQTLKKKKKKQEINAIHLFVDHSAYEIHYSVKKIPALLKMCLTVQHNGKVGLIPPLSLIHI